MGACRTAHSASETRRAQARSQHAGGVQRHHVHAEHRMPMALYPQGLAAAQHGEPLLLPVGVGRHAGSHSSRALREMPRTSGKRGQSHRLHYRQPEREERRKRGASIDPHGFDAGKKIKGKKRHILVDTQGLLLLASVHSAGVQDRDGGVSLLAMLFGRFPFLEKLFADSAYQGPIFAMRSAKSCLVSTSKSSSDPIKRRGSCSCPSAGSSSARSPGSTVVVDWPRTGKISTSTPSRSCVSPPSDSCSENSVIPRNLSGQTLRRLHVSTGGPCLILDQPSLQAVRSMSALLGGLQLGPTLCEVAREARRMDRHHGSIVLCPSFPIGEFSPNVQGSVLAIVVQANPAREHGPLEQTRSCRLRTCTARKDGPAIWL